jgi:hypothetical protein
LLDWYRQFISGDYGGYSSVVLFVILAWSLFWKGMSLWKASKNNQKYWFVALMLINTLGILDILYISFFQRKDK